MSPPTPRRVVLYSHDAQGLGHLRRNIELAASLVRHRPTTEVLLIGSSPAATRLPLPSSTRLALVPTVRKRADGSYAAGRRDLGLETVLRRRSDAVVRLLRQHPPDLFVSDKHARGLAGELDGALQACRGLRGPGGRRTRVVLGLRDVLDSPEVARAEWRAARTTQTVLDHYDQVWVYGDPAVYDPVDEYALPEGVAERVRYTGYLARGRSRLGSEPGPLRPTTPYVLCLVGGGQDGAALAHAFVDSPLPVGHTGVLVTGPLMAEVEVTGLRRRAAGRPDLVVHAFVDDASTLVAGAAAVVTMGGYNSVCEVLAAARPVLVVPRVSPRREQLVRAARLARYTHLEVADPTMLPTGVVGQWLGDAVHRPVAAHGVDLGGLARVPLLADELVDPLAAEVLSAGA